MGYQSSKLSSLDQHVFGGVDNAHLFNFTDPVLSVDKLKITIAISVQRFTSGAGPVLESTTFGPPFVDSPVSLRILGTKYV